MQSRVVVLTAVALALGVSAGAESIGPSCSSCFGGIYTVTYNGVSSTSTTETREYTYTADLTGYTGAMTDFISSVALKVTNNVLGASLASPTGGTWTSPFLNTNQTNAGCTGSGSGWVCISGGNSTEAKAGSVYSWVFDITANKSSWLGDTSIQANFDPANGHLLSETIHMPEGPPAELPLTLAGLGVWAFWQRRNRRIKQSSANVQ
jgi:hypothetical protein